MLWQVCELDNHCLLSFISRPQLPLSKPPFTHTQVDVFLLGTQWSSEGYWQHLFPRCFFWGLWRRSPYYKTTVICPCSTLSRPFVSPPGSSELTWTMTCQSQLGLDWFFSPCVWLIHLFTFSLCEWYNWGCNWMEWGVLGVLCKGKRRSMNNLGRGFSEWCFCDLWYFSLLYRSKVDKNGTSGEK